MTTKVNLYRNDYAALNGTIVCQGHTDACAEFGHATYRLNGVVQDRCPRCDALLATNA
jgi:hypothetical protein